MSDQVNLYNPHNGLTGRDGGPYLDQEERRLAEIVRASKEEREPDFESAPATAGTPLVTAGVLVAMANPASNPSKSATVDAMTNAVELLADNEEFPATPHASRDKTDAEKEADDIKANPQDHHNPASHTLISEDSADVSEQTREVSAQDAPEESDSSENSDESNADETTSNETDAQPPFSS